jgi:hypothetical protein
MTLPPDLWTKPDAFGGTGLAIGFLVGFPLSFYLFPGVSWNWRRFKSTGITIACMILGMSAGEVIRLFWLGYLP